MGAIGSFVSGFCLIFAAFNDYGRVLTKFFLGCWVSSGMIHFQRTWIIYLLILILGLIFTQFGHLKAKKILGNRSSYSSLLIVLMVFLSVLSCVLLVHANAVNWRGDAVPYWDVCLFTEGNSTNIDWNMGILFCALTISIIALLGVTQILWGKIYQGSNQNLKNHKVIHFTGLALEVSGIILLFEIIPIYLDWFRYTNFHFLLFVPFLVSQILSSVTFLTMRTR